MSAETSYLMFMFVSAAVVMDMRFDGRASHWFAELVMDGLNGFKAARRQRKMITAMRAEEERLNKLKARVLAVGPIYIHRRNGKVVAATLFSGWEFYADEPIPEYRVGMDGIQRYMGWTPAELAEIHARRDEFTS